MEGNVEEIIRDNTGLIYDVMKKLNLVGDADAMSAGLWALYRSIELYDPDNTTAKFSTYAYCAIYNRVNGVHRTNNSKTNRQTMLLFDATSQSSNAEQDNYNYQEAIFKDNTCMEDTIETSERCKVVTEFLEAYIWSLKEHTLPKIILSNWYYLHECDVQLGDLAAESGCSHAYVRKVLKEFREYLAVYMQHQDID